MNLSQRCNICRVILLHVIILSCTCCSLWYQSSLTFTLVGDSEEFKGAQVIFDGKRIGTIDSVIILHLTKGLHNVVLLAKTGRKLDMSIELPKGERYVEYDAKENSVYSTYGVQKVSSSGHVTIRPL